MAGNEQIRIDVTANDDASDVIDDVADAAKRLEKLDPEVDVTADTGSAVGDLKAAGDAADALSRADHELVLRARIDDAKGELKQLRTELDQTGEKAEDTARKLDRVGGDGGGGIQTRGNAIADLTGPLGEASSAASDFAGVFDGLGDIATDVASKLGASQATTAAVGSALGGLGIAVAAGAAIWSSYTAAQKKAKEEAQKLAAAQRDVADAVREGDVDQFVKSIREGYPKALDAADKLGISLATVTRYITGQRDELPGLDDKLQKYNIAQREAGASNDEAAEKMYALTYALLGARDAYLEANGAASEQRKANADIAAGMPQLTSRTDDQTDATDELTAATERGAKTMERAGRAHEVAQGKIDATGAAYDRLRGKLDIEDAVDRFNTAWVLAVDAVKNNTADADQKIRDLKGAYLDLSETVKANPAEVAVTFDTISREDLETVRTSAERYFVQNPIMATVKAKGATVSGGGGGSIRPTMVEPATTVVMNVPRGYRGDLLGDARRASRRSGRRYQHGGV